MKRSDGARKLFEDRLHALRGRTLTTIDYWDIHNYGPEPASWDYGDWHHAVMGAQLGTDLGPVTVTWTSTFYPYGVEVFHEPIEHYLLLSDFGPERVGPDVDGSSPWARLLGSPIHSTASHWERVTIGPGSRAEGSITGKEYTVDVPIAVRLDLAAASVWFVAGIPQLPDPRRVFIPGDEIMVVFAEAKCATSASTTRLSSTQPHDQARRPGRGPRQMREHLSGRFTLAKSGEVGNRSGAASARYIRPGKV